MPEYLTDRTISLSPPSNCRDFFIRLGDKVRDELAAGESAIRFAVTKSCAGQWHCDVGVHAGSFRTEPIFGFVKRTHEESSSFNVVMLVPTGIGAEIGGHAGDSAPAATLLASVSDCLITHPNVLNASDLIQIPENVLYVEGSVIAATMMGTSRLSRVRANRVIVLVQAHEDQLFTEMAINAVNAARAYYGLNVTEVVTIDPGFRMVAEYSTSGVATGRIEGLSYIWDALDCRLGEFDSVAISSVIEVPFEYHEDYYRRKGEMINPWGGVEALLTHAISSKYGIPAAHSPMFESRTISELDVGVVDSRMAAEVVSITFLQSVLRGLQKSPRILSGECASSNTLGAESIAALVIPIGCVGIPTLAALHQGIPVIAVRENENIMLNDLTQLPWRNRQLFIVENYWEAIGVLSSLKAGLDPYAVRRPFESVSVTSGSRKSKKLIPSIVN